MASLVGVFFAVLTLYLVLGTILAIWSRRKLRGGLSDYYTGAGRLGSFLSAMTYAATTYSSFMIVGLVGFTYTTGAGAFGFEISYFVATMILLVLIGKRVWKLSRERGWISPAEMLSDATGAKWVAVLASLVFMVSLIFYASAQLKAIGETVAAAGGEQYYAAGVIIGLLIMIIWSSLAGIWSVAATDALQGLWMIGASLGLLGWLLYELHTGGVSLASTGRILVESGHLVPRGVNGYWSLATFTAFSLPWIFFAVTNPQAFQRLFMPKDEKALGDMVKWFGVFGLSYTVIVTLIGLLAYVADHAGILNIGIELSAKYADRVTPTLLRLSGPVLGSIVFTSIIAAAVSTADSILLTLASSASRDLLPSSASERSRQAAGILTIVVIGIIMSIIALMRVAFIVKLSVLSSLMLLGLAPPMLAIIAGFKVKPAAAGISIVMGPALVTAVLISELGSAPNPVVAVIKTFGSTPLGVPLAAWILVASTFFTLLGLRR